MWLNKMTPFLIDLCVVEKGSQNMHTKKENLKSHSSQPISHIAPYP